MKIALLLSQTELKIKFNLSNDSIRRFTIDIESNHY